MRAAVLRGPSHQLVVLLVMVIVHAPLATAQSSDMVRHAFSGGAVDVAGGSLRLMGTVGEAGPVGQADGGNLSLGKGFWAGFNLLMAVDVPGPRGSGIHYTNALGQNTPNPFRDATSIAFSVARPSPVRMVVYDVTGRRVVTLVDAPYSPGQYRMEWGGHDDWGSGVAAGIYFYRLQVGSWSHTRKMLRLK